MIGLLNSVALSAVLFFVYVIVFRRSPTEEGIHCKHWLGHHFIRHGREKVCCRCGIFSERVLVHSEREYVWHATGYVDNPQPLIERWREEEKQERQQERQRREDHINKIRNTRINKGGVNSG